MEEPSAVELQATSSPDATVQYQRILHGLSEAQARRLTRLLAIDLVIGGGLKKPNLDAPKATSTLKTTDVIIHEKDIAAPAVVLIIGVKKFLSALDWNYIGETFWWLGTARVESSVILPIVFNLIKIIATVSGNRVQAAAEAGPDDGSGRRQW